MALVQIDHNPSRRNLLSFGALLGIFLGVVGAMLRWRFGQPIVANCVWIAALVLPTVYYLAPPIQRPLYVGWMYATFPIGFVVSYVLLAFAYFLVFVPVGFARRLLSGDPLNRKLDRHATSYWTPHRRPPDSKRYFRQS